MLVVDSSAVLEALAARAPAPGLVDRLAEDGDLHAPHLIDTAVLHALRRLLRRGQLTGERAHDARTDLAELTLVRYPHEPLSDRVWVGVPLVTCDARLAAVPGHRAHVEVYDNRAGVRLQPSTPA